VGTTDSAGNVLQYQPVTVTYNVLVAVAISSQPYSGTFVYGGSNTTGTASVAVAADGLQWRSTSDSPWLTVPTGTQTGTGSVQAAIDVASLTPGTYQGHVTITDVADSTNTATVAFSVTIQAPTISATQTSVVLGGADGLSTATPQSITFSLSTDTVMHPFAITMQTLSGGNWLTSNITTGSVNAAGTTIQVSGERTGLVGGTYLARVQIAATVGSITVTGEIPVTFNVEANRIVVGASGVGFSSSPAGSVLTRAVTVFDSLGRTDVPWQATSDESWLTVTPSGVTGGALTLTASPSGLPTDTTQFATVTVSSSDTSVENTETIRVGIYVSSAAPTDLSQSVAEQTLAASPVEPIVFVANAAMDVTGYNVYTGAIDRTFAGVATQAGPMVVSGDGQYLFVYDWSN
ncbi:MAG: BACON domain-containing protein, partial [Steroidobacteraceae bacterium]